MMISRYSLPEAEKVWTRQHRFDLMKDVEVALCEAWCRLGEIPMDSLKVIKEKMSYTIERVDELERITDHDVVAFVNALGETVPEQSCYIHKGATSSDILDTATSMQVVEAGKIILSELDKLIATMKARAVEFKHTPEMGRTHGIHAEPISFGLKLLSFYQELRRDKKRLEDAINNNRVGKMSGAVGTYANLHPDLEQIVCELLGLEPDPVTTQVISRDRHAEFLLAIAQLGATIDRIGTQLRTLQRTEIGEVEEAFKVGQTGSSAMPHKKNPKTSEQLCGLARILRANAMVALENVALWDERDISHSSVERVILPDSSILAAYMTRKMNSIVANLVVNKDRMAKNMEMTGGAIFSGRLLVALMSRGVGRDQAYGVVQRLAIPASRGGTPLKEACISDSEVRRFLDEGDINAIFDVGFYLRYIDDIFLRNLEEP